MSRRPEVELSDEAARYVEQHPGVIEKLAAGVPDESDEAALRARVRTRLRTRLREIHAYNSSDEGRAETEALRAKYGLTR